jgi:hypothetical protein
LLKTFRNLNEKAFLTLAHCCVRFWVTVRVGLGLLQNTDVKSWTVLGNKTCASYCVVRVWYLHILCSLTLYWMCLSTVPPLTAVRTQCCCMCIEWHIVLLTWCISTKYKNFSFYYSSCIWKYNKWRKSPVDSWILLWIFCALQDKTQ